MNSSKLERYKGIWKWAVFGCIPAKEIVSDLQAAGKMRKDDTKADSIISRDMSELTKKYPRLFGKEKEGNQFCVALWST